MATMTDPEKKIDLPPRGSRNADPITDAPGSHPIETGIGAAVAGAASGLAVGAMARTRRRRRRHRHRGRGGRLCGQGRRRDDRSDDRRQLASRQLPITPVRRGRWRVTRISSRRIDTGRWPNRSTAMRASISWTSSSRTIGKRARIARCPGTKPRGRSRTHTTAPCRSARHDAAPIRASRCGKTDKEPARKRSESRPVGQPPAGRLSCVCGGAFRDM